MFLKKCYYKVKKNPDFVRHICKTISYRVLNLFITFFIIYFLTGDPKISLAFSTIEIVVKSSFYFLHERIWFKYIRFKKNNENK